MVRRNLYVVIDPTAQAIIADKYEISSAITPNSYIAWHTALEFHGIAHQPFYNAFVASSQRFNDFYFEGIHYHYCSATLDPSADNGVVQPSSNPYVRVTNKERTIVDCSDRIDRAGGIEELIHCLEGIHSIDEQKLIKYLEQYNKTFLYQKVGYLIELTRQTNRISTNFIEMCRAKGAIHPKRLTNSEESTIYVATWKLYVPTICTTINQQYELI